MEINKIYAGDCLEVMQEFPDNSIDTIITDPPYGLEFMGKKWDYDVPSIETWRECLRVLKPGGTALIFAGSRTQHRMAVNVEDAGFILKDCIIWLYGSGFPKATDISKQLDKRKDWTRSIEFSKKLKEARESLKLTKQQAFEKCNFKAQTFGGNSWFEDGRLPSLEDYKLLKSGLKLGNEFDLLFEEAEREFVKKDKNWGKKGNIPLSGYKEFDITESKTPEAKLWNGWKSHGLKPAYEPILVAMKPNDGTYANNALKHGVSGLNIDGGRIGGELPEPMTGQGYASQMKTNKEQGYRPSDYYENQEGFDYKPNPQGRFPANVILDEHTAQNAGEWSRYFYCAKASKAERNAGCEGLKDIEQHGHYAQDEWSRKNMGNTPDEKREPTKNNHPTVKPLKLMEYLCKLTKIPTGGIVLDPFVGSGTTLLAAKNVGRPYIGIEREAEYVEIAESRLSSQTLL
ncbi:hypothetical protein CMI37_11525 [Candidatus Pacearchaeota archaeon]|nr:hypothetical protein [Candidatus Pacearchaeota archaeon]|tara:strand:- start:12701 stop:14074 length:1374 start_codon:yes stop_codon:yes gene_type:complete